MPELDFVLYIRGFGVSGGRGFWGVGGGRFWWFGARMRRGFGVWVDEAMKVCDDVRGLPIGFDCNDEEGVD